jgi:hypothetical protein
MARSAQETDSKLGDAAKAELQNAIETPLSQMMDEESKSHDEAFIDLALETLECAPHSREITDGPGDAGIDYYEMTPTTETIALMECATRSAFRLDSRPSMMFLPRGRGREGRSGAPGCSDRAARQPLREAGRSRRAEPASRRHLEAPSRPKDRLSAQLRRREDPPCRRRAVVAGAGRDCARGEAGGQCRPATADAGTGRTAGGPAGLSARQPLTHTGRLNGDKASLPHDEPH